MNVENRQIELLEIESSTRQHHEQLEHYARYMAEDIKASYARFALLSPSIYRDGNEWCVKLGDKCIADNDFVGFGKTPHDAIVDWDGSFNRKINKIKQR